MKEIFFAALTLLAVLPAAQAGCPMKDSTTADIRRVVNANGGWPISDAQCALLNEKKLLLAVTGDATVLDGVSVAWISVSLADSALNIHADAIGMSTQVNAKKASMDVAEKMQYAAIEAAVKALDFNKAVREIDAYRAKTAASVKQPARR